MNSPKCSIIVPVYKAEEYIDRCIESILNQACPDWELILVDDGSPDNSGAICDEYAAGDKRIKVLHQANQGVSSARNNGLRAVSGEHILFLDSDDWLDVNCIGFCLKEMNRTNADVLQFPTERTSQESNDTTRREIEAGTAFTAKEYLESGNILVSIGGTVVRTSIIQSNDIRFRHDIKLAEDQMFIMDCLSNSKTVYRSEYPFYKYYVNENSATNNSKSKNIIDSIEALIDYKREHPIFAKIIDYTLLYFIWYLIKNKDVPTSRISRLIKDAAIAHNGKFSKIEKGFISIGHVSPLLAVYYVRLYKFLKK